MRWRMFIAVALIAMAGLSSPAYAGALAVDEKIPVYKKDQGVSGNLNSIGSDTMNNLMTYWAEGFARYHPTVKVQVEGKGSSTAPPALISGTAQLGPMSRPMKNTEIDQFEEKFGYKPLQLRTAVDALAVYVHKDNPIDGLSMPVVDAVFSKTRRLGHAGEVASWGQIGLDGAWSVRQISLYGRNSASGTYGFFKDHALAGGDFKDEVKEQPGSASVVQGVAEDIAGIGYSGIGYRTSGVKALALAPKEGEAAVEPTPDNVYSGDYPLARFLYVYVNKNPEELLDPLIAEFVRFVFSKEGQEVVIKDGYLPVPASVVEAELRKLGIGE